MPSYPSSPYVSYAVQAATAGGVPPELLLGLITTENKDWVGSAVNHNANGTMDFGLTQLNTKYYPDAYTMTPYQQIDKTVSILAANYKAKGNWWDAVAAYNGSGAVTQTYAQNVFDTATSYGWQATSASDAARTGAPIDPTVISVSKNGGTTVTIDLPAGTTNSGGTATTPNPGTATDGSPTTAPTGMGPNLGLLGGLDLSKLTSNFNWLLLIVGLIIAALAIVTLFNGGGGDQTIEVKVPKTVPIPV